MSKSSKPAQSGLGTVRRDWSDSSVTQEPRSSQSIDWPLTPINSVQPAARKLTGAAPTLTNSVQPATRKLTGPEQRLKDIQDALAGYSPTVPRPVPTPPLVESQAQNKRASPSENSDTAHPTKKTRLLPPGWQRNDILSKPSLSCQPANNKKSITEFSAPVQQKIAKVFLSQEQTKILKLVEDGNSVFYTGSAGTGKSVLLREIIKTLKKKHDKAQDAVAITASTGIAACNIGGVTIHSFSGIGLGIESADELAVKIKKNKKASMRWARTQVLIIDEVSMVDGDLFDKLAKIACVLRKSFKPFGGIQVIVTGDFFQLPPVTKGSNQVKFAFEAQMWTQTVKHTYNLTKVFRQRDQTFIDMLNEMRFGTLTVKSIQVFQRLSRSIEYEGELVPTELFPRREDVERSNSTRMSHLKTEEESFHSIDGGMIQDMGQREKMLANFMAPQRLTLRIGAQVMLIKNSDDMLVNGSMGKVLRFVDPAIYGTPDDPESIMSGAGVVGAGSSAPVSSGTKKTQNAAAIGVKRYPVVEFDLHNGIKRRVLIMPEVWKVELPSGEVQVSRTQIPLIPAWAMSIHKSQGQTLERVKVDLGKVFEKGQAYVALSRATTLEGLQVLNFDANKVRAHPKVIEWSKTLSTVLDS